MGEPAIESTVGNVTAERWPRRPAWSWLIRALVFAVPLAAGFAAGLAVAGALPRPHGVWAAVGWYSATLAASLATLLVVDRLARRLLPLASLLRLTLVFPDQAPSRLAVALGASSRTRLDAELRRASNPDEEASVRTLVTLAASLTNHDRRTRGHAERTRAFAELVGEELGLSSRDRDRLRWAALLHDIGKIRVPATLLNKHGPLTDREWATVSRHPREGAALVEPMRPWLGDWVDGIGQHHERFDGSGYPNGLARGDISLAARIIAVADSFETMTAVRSYNKPKTVVEARQELVRCAGSDFDPVVVRGMLNVSLGRVRWTIGLAAWVAEMPFLGVPARVSAEVVTRAAAVQPAANAAVGAVLVAAATVAVPAIPATTTVPAPPVSAPAAPAGSPAAPALGTGGGTSVATVVTTSPPAPTPALMPATAPTVPSPAATPAVAPASGTAAVSAADANRGGDGQGHSFDGGGDHGDGQGRGDQHDSGAHNGDQGDGSHRSGHDGDH